jgi:glutathione S-transferase
MNAEQIKRVCREMEQGLKDTGLFGEQLTACAMAVAATLARDCGMSNEAAADKFERTLEKLPPPKEGPGIIDHQDIEKH